MSSEKIETITSVWVAGVCDTTWIDEWTFFEVFTEVNEDVASALVVAAEKSGQMAFDRETADWLRENLLKDLKEGRTDVSYAVGLHSFEFEFKQMIIDEDIESIDPFETPHPVKRGDTVYLFVDTDVPFGVYSVPFDEDEDLCQPFKI